MAAFDEAMNNWLHNGMHERVEAVYCRINSHADGQDSYLYSEKLALIAYTLGLKEVFKHHLPPRGSIEGRGFLNFLLGTPEGCLENVQDLAYNFRKLMNKNTPSPQEKEQIFDFFGFLLRYYHYGLVGRDNENQFSFQALKLAQVCLDKKYANDADGSKKADVINRILGFNTSRAKSAQWRKEIPLYFKMAALIVKDCPSVDSTIALCDNIRAYLAAKNMLPDDNFIEGLKNNVIPAVVQNPSHLLAGIGNLWGSLDFEYGIGDYTLKAMTSKVTPANLNELLMIAKEFPTADYAAFMQNRQDAICLNSGHFDPLLRNLIHDQHPNVAKLIQAMIGYYDAFLAKDKNLLSTTKENLIQTAKQTHKELDIENLLDLQNYQENIALADGKTAIELLRRLQKNTNISLTPKPQNLPQDMQLAADNLDKAADYTDYEALGKILGQINDDLCADIQHKKIGISPKKLQLINWVEQKTVEAIHRFDYEYQVGAYKEDWFKQAVLFNELTHQDSNSFNRKKFEQWYQKDILEKAPLEAYHALADRQNQLLEGLCRKYKKIALEAHKKQQLSCPRQGFTQEEISQRLNQQTQGRMSAIGSGLLKQLQSLTTFRPASTRVGEKDRDFRLKDGWFELSCLLKQKSR